MKTLAQIFILAVFATASLHSQVPEGFNFQALARDGNGNLIANKTVTLTAQIRSGSATGALVWEEKQETTTNEFGLMSLVICGDNALRTGGSASNVGEINWAGSLHFLGLKIDAGNGLVDLGATQLRSVPYSLASAASVQSANTLQLQPETATLPGEAIFMVRREDGYPVFAVYEDGVWVYTDTTDAGKGKKGGFAVGGYNARKGGPAQEYMRVTADSTRIFVNNDPLKGKKGGFAVGGYNSLKSGTTDNFLWVDGDSTRIYVNNDVKKGRKGGFAVGGYNSQKANDGSFMYLERDNYFIGHNSGKNISSGIYNSVLGYESGLNITSGSSNAFIGYQAGFNNKEGNGNLFLGYQTGYNNIWGNYNTFLGYKAGFSNVDGMNNTFLGTLAGYNNIWGMSNTFVGDSTGYFNTTGTNNSFYGTRAGVKNTTGYSNVLIGETAGYNNNGVFNVFIGHESGQSNLNAGSNIFIGYRAGLKSTSGWNNIYIGTQTGSSNIDGEGNVFLGYESGLNNQHGTRNVFLGNTAGRDEMGSDKLYITNWDSDSTETLIWGDFAKRKLRFTADVGIGIYPRDNLLTLYQPVSVGGIALYGTGNGYDYSAIYFKSDTLTPEVGYTMSYKTDASFHLGYGDGNGYFPRIHVSKDGNFGINTWAGTESLRVYDDNDVANVVVSGIGNGYDYSSVSLEASGLPANKTYSMIHTINHAYLLLYYNGSDFIPRYLLSESGNMSINTWEEGTEVLDVNGNARFRGVGSAGSANDLRVTANGTLTTNTSDARLKSDFQPLVNSLEKVLQMKGFTYSWKDDQDGKRDAGLVAQDVEKVFPEAVFVNPSDGFYGINYSRFPALFVEAFKEQQEIIRSQQEEIEDMKYRIEKLEKLIQ